MADNFLNVNIERFNKQLFKDYNKTKEDLQEYIELLGKWAASQPHLPENPDHHILKFFILCNKFSIEKAKQKLDMYYTIRNLMPEYFNTTPFTPDMVFEYKVWFIVPLPKPTEDNTRIIYHRLNPEYDDPKYFIHDKIICQFLHLMEYLIHEDMCYKYHYICDCSGYKLGHGTGMSPMTVRKGVLILEKVFSNRMQSFYMVNMPSFLEAIVNNVFKPLLNTKIQKRFKVYTDSHALLDVFGKEILPKDLGGEERSAKELNDILLQKFDQYKDRLEVAKDLRVDESLRLTKLKNDEVLGYYGNFKKLNVD